MPFALSAVALDQFEAVYVSTAESIRADGRDLDAEAIERLVDNVAARANGFPAPWPDHVSEPVALCIDQWEAEANYASQRWLDDGFPTIAEHIDAATDVLLALAYGFQLSSGTDPDRFEA